MAPAPVEMQEQRAELDTSWGALVDGVLLRHADAVSQPSFFQRCETASSGDGLPASPASSEDSLRGSLQRKAELKRALLHRPEYDPPAKIADGLFIGGVGAARDLEKLEELGVTHVVNASPIVPCFHRRRLRYRSICVYDDEQDDIAQHFAATIAFITKGRRRGGVLVHCYAGQSRSSTLVMAYLIEREKLRLQEALLVVQAARPCASPNSGFMRQLETFAVAVHSPAAEAVGQPADAAGDDAMALC